jgi:hypothetical protein
MKRFALPICLIAALMAGTGCKKEAGVKQSDNTLQATEETNQQLKRGCSGSTEWAEVLFARPGFPDLAKHFLIDFYNNATYYRTQELQWDQAGFMRAVKKAKDDDCSLGNAFEQYGLNIETAIVKKNRVDNDLLLLLNQNEALRDMGEEEVREILSDALELGMSSSLPVWVDVRNDVATALQRLTIDGVWECAKKALGLGSKSVLGIAGLQALAKQGIQQVVVTVSKWLAKKAGWIGAVIVVLDFTSCIIEQSHE